MARRVTNPMLRHKDIIRIALVLEGYLDKQLDLNEDSYDQDYDQEINQKAHPQYS